MDAEKDPVVAPNAGPTATDAAFPAARAGSVGAGDVETPSGSDARRSPSPPGTVLAAGLMIGTAIAEMGFLLAQGPGPFLPHGPWNGVSLLRQLRQHAVLWLDVGMIVLGFALCLRGARWTSWALATVLAHGVVTLAGIVAEVAESGAVLFDEHASPIAAATVQISAVAQTTLLPFVLLFGVWWALRRRAGHPVAAAPWRRIVAVAEGVLACAFIGMAAYMAAVVPRDMAGMHGAEAPQDASASGAEGGVLGGADDDSVAGDLLPEIDPALFRNPLDAVGGGTKPVWEGGPSATLVDFWASWCPPCLAELPDLQAVQERLAGRGVKIVLVNVDLGDPAGTAKFLERKGIHLGGLVDRDGILFQALGLQALPSTFVLDAEGRPVRFFEGAMSPPELETALLRANDKGVRRTFQ